MSISLPIILTFVFFLVLIGIAAWGMRNTNNVNDFFLGGRTLGPWILSFSYGAAYFSAVIFVGFSGQFGWKFGLSAIWIGVANAIIGCGLAWLVLGKRTRRMSHNLKSLTMPEFFAARYETNGMKILSALIIFIFLLPYTASVYKGLAYLFGIAVGENVPFYAILSVITAVSFFYVTFGGYKAIARIDFVLGAIMLVGSVCMACVLVSQFGGISEVIHEVPARLAERMDLPEGDPMRVATPWYVLPSIIFMTSFGVWGLPQMIHKYYAISDEKQIWRGAIITTIFAMFIGCSAYLTGSMSHLMPDRYEKQKAVVSVIGERKNDDPTEDAKQEVRTYPPLQKNAAGKEIVDYDKLVPDLIYAKLPEALMALILLLVLSASLSTLSSLVLVSSSAITIDLYKGYVNPKVDKKIELRIMRALCGLFILLSYVIALTRPSWIVTLMSLSWGSTAGAFLAPYIYGLFWKRTTKYGAYAGMLTGLIVSNGGYAFITFYYGGPQAQALSPVIASLAMIVPFAVLPIVSLLTTPPSPETISRAFAPGENSR